MFQVIQKNIKLLQFLVWGRCVESLGVLHSVVLSSTPKIDIKTDRAKLTSQKKDLHNENLPIFDGNIYAAA